MTQLTSRALVATDKPARYISRLCKHFAHKIPVRFDEQQGQITFEIGEASLHADSNGLTLQVDTKNPADLAKLQHLVASHFERFAWQDALTLDWH